MVQGVPQKRPTLSTPARGRPTCWFLRPSTCIGLERIEAARSCPYPLPCQRYPLPVFHHPGILHRDSCTKTRAIAPALVARLKRRDHSCIGDDLGPESLGDGVSAATSTRASAKPPNRSSCTPTDQPSSVARHDIQRPEVAWSQSSTTTVYVRGYGKKWPESCTGCVAIA